MPSRSGALVVRGFHDCMHRRPERRNFQLRLPSIGTWTREDAVVVPSHVEAQ